MLVMTSMVAHDKLTPASEKMAKQLFAVLQHRSQKEAAELFPSLTDFYKMMEQNTGMYGDFLPEAKAAFEKNYKLTLMPAFQQAYDNMLLEAQYKGIDWSEAKLSEIKEESSTAHPVIINFSSKGSNYQLIVERTISVNGEWKPSQYMKLIKV